MTVATPGRMANYPGSVSLASLGLRCGAFLLDYILTILIPAVTLVIAVYLKRRWMAPEIAGFVLTFGYLAMGGLLFYNWGFLTVMSGRSFGKSFIGLRVIRKDGEPMDYKTALLRHFVGYPLSILFFGLGMLWMFWDPKQQGWHDKIAGTLVIKD